ncbi:DHA2 family efflux MFS transporter permease subunit [Yinghuangia sp. ASG 101]|uniref:DHA2 family efflux MFS transporter permease subunit n=1 Tax=Yinghuangia sp. ASG 101 TaxID=2896848 RepID=UPI001E3E3F66|nr:DHA2 family efflux MFS transporter permease subunit [Yinghuangia sp. ASG 101]UGQ12961.1 DHA2 family efflux MFS transporter permease subunit [Yinghuangia sp. ASG 101]
MNPRTAAATAYVTSLLMAALDTHVVNIMLPALTRDFDATLPSVQWTVIGYVLALAITMPASAWLSGRWGVRRVFVASTLLFVAASAGCAAAGGLAELIVARFAQGAAGGLVAPVATAMLYATYPQEERARMTRLLLLPIALGPALAPPLGGLLVEHLSWRVAFLLNAPIGIATVALVLLGLPRDAPRDAFPFGTAGFVTAGLGLSGALFVLGEAPRYGWGSPLIVATAAGSAVLLGCFVRVELRATTPMLGLRLLSEPLFRHTNTATAFQTAAFLGGLLYVMPLLLQEHGGRSPFTAGLVVGVVPVGVVLAAQTVGRRFDSIGPRRLVVAGQLSLAVVLAVLSAVPGDAPLWLFCLLMGGAGFSNGMGMVGLQASMFAHIPPASISRAATVLNVNRQVATALGVGVATAILTTAADASIGATAFRGALLVAAACSLAAAVAALPMPGLARAAPAAPGEHADREPVGGLGA